MAPFTPQVSSHHASYLAQRTVCPACVLAFRTSHISPRLQLCSRGQLHPEHVTEQLALAFSHKLGSVTSIRTDKKRCLACTAEQRDFSRVGEVGLT